MIGQDIENELTMTFDQLSQEVQNNYIRNWTMEIYSWLNRARAYVAQESSLLEKLSIRSLNSLAEVQEMLKNKKVAKKMITNQSILIDGYILLNKIGEIIRAEEITYSITVSQTGESLTSGNTGGVYTWKIPLSEFINILNFTSQRIVLKDSSAIYKMIESQINQESNSVNYEQWSDEKLQSFSLFANQVRTNPRWPNWHNVNEGNLLEAFFRFLDDGYQPQITADTFYWKQVGSAMKRTMSAPDKFFMGGDLNDLQIKGLNASVTNLNTLIQNLEKVLKILMGSQSSQEVIRKYMRKNYDSSKINRDMQNIEDNVIENLLNFFTSSISR